MLADFRHAVRLLFRHSGFSATVVALVALAIGLNATVFSLVNAVLFKPLPIPRADRLVVVSLEDARQPQFLAGVSYPDWQVYRDECRTVDHLEAVGRQLAVLSDAMAPSERAHLGVISPGMFQLLNVHAVIGRMFGPSDLLPNAPPVVLLSHSLWKTRYAGAREVIGRTVRVNREPATVIGVMPAGFKFPDNEELWMPLRASPARADRGYHDLRVFGLLRPGMRLEDAQSELRLIGARLAHTYPDANRDLLPKVQTFHDVFGGGQARAMFVLMLGAVFLVLLTACANLANMMLARGLARTTEMAIRSAIGASRGQLIRQLVIESLLLSGVGGILGLIAAMWGTYGFDLATRSLNRPYWLDFSVDGRVVAYVGAIVLLTGFAFGLMPALRVAHRGINAGLKVGGMTTSLGGGRLRRTLVGVQFALTLILLVSAGLLVRSFVASQGVNRFVPAAHLLTARVMLPEGAGEPYEAAEKRRQFHETLQAALARLPGVQEAVLTSDFPGLGSLSNRAVEIEDHRGTQNSPPPSACIIAASPNYLAAANLPLIAGRALGAGDGAPGREAAVVSRTFARLHWPGESPLGRRFRFAGDGKPGAWISVIGICGDIIQDTLDRNAPPPVYISNQQEPWGWAGIMLRTDKDPALLAAPVRAAVQAIDPDLPVFEIQSLAAASKARHWNLVIFGALFLLFAGGALLMATVGLYAIVAQTMILRTREMGIRLALGASPERIIGLLVSDGARQVGIGLGVGLLGAVAGAQLLRSFLVLISPADPIVFAGVCLLLAAIGMTASWLPARRAAQINPVEALRSD